MKYENWLTSFFEITQTIVYTIEESLPCMYGPTVGI